MFNGTDETYVYRRGLLTMFIYWSEMNQVDRTTDWNLMTIFSVKKGTLPLRWVSSPGPFVYRSNALSSELRRFHKTFITESIYAKLATDIS